MWIEVAAGGRLPADGKLLSPFASFDESALTGESIPVERATGDKVPAGATSVDRLVTLEVLSEPGASAIDRILKLIEEAEERRPPLSGLSTVSAVHLYASDYGRRPAGDAGATAAVCRQLAGVDL